MLDKVLWGDAHLSKLAIHRVGNKSRNEGIMASKALLPLDSEYLADELKSFFLHHFKKEEFYRFSHPTDLNQNSLYQVCLSLFEQGSDDELFYEKSVEVLQYLYDKSEHSRIASGELYICYFSEILIEDELVDGIGIFKVETQNKFLKIKLSDAGNWVLHFDEGTQMDAIDKGCLVLNTYSNEGFKILSVDIKSGEARYWLDDFLMLDAFHDEQYLTKTYMNLCKQFSKNHFDTEEKQEQVSFLNKTIEYFNSNESFDITGFTDEIFEDIPEKKERFQEYKTEFQEKVGLLPEEERFFISAPTVKKTERSFKRIIQLDNQIEIKFQNNRAQDEGLVEKGYDEEKGLSYYKIYYTKEF